MKRVIRRSSDEASRNNNYNNTSSFPARSVWYLECQKNHAAGIGGYAVDGCREFMASSTEEGSPGALLCAACGCHRSFHRRQVQANAVVAECNSPPNNSSSTAS